MKIEIQLEHSRLDTPKFGAFLGDNEKCRIAMYFDCYENRFGLVFLYLNDVLTGAIPHPKEFLSAVESAEVKPPINADAEAQE